ncbi:MAG: TIGR02594 family protein [Pyrinomonadaceae bacterium]
MTFEQLLEKELDPKTWSLIQRGLQSLGFYEGTFLGIPQEKTKAAYKAYTRNEDSTPESTPWMISAEREIGVKEFPGEADNPEVVKYLRSISSLAQVYQNNDETSWCSAFVNWCLKENGIPGSNNAAARSWLAWGKRVNTPKRGAVTVLWRNKPESWEGHVGFFVKEEQGRIFLLGGNQSDAVNVSSYPKHRLLQYRMPG